MKNKMFINNFKHRVFSEIYLWTPYLRIKIHILSYQVHSVRFRATRVGKLQRSLPRFFDSASVFGRSRLSRRVDLMSHLSHAQYGKWTEFAKPGDPWASGRLFAEVLVALARGSSTGVRTNTIQGVRKRLATHSRPFAGTHEKIPV